MTMPVRVTMVCLGNICRSPMAAAVLRTAVADAGLGDEIVVDSAGTADYHEGNPADRRARAALRARGHDDPHRARQVKASDFASSDLLVAMDRSNRDDLVALAPDDAAAAKVVLLRSFDPQAPLDAVVPDPYYDGLFDRALDLIEDAVPGLVDHLRTLR